MKQTANILAMFTMKFVIKMYASSMKIALHTYFWVVCIGNCQCGPCNALLIAHSLCQKKKRKKIPSKKWQPDFQHWGPINWDNSFRGLNRSSGCYICLRMRAVPARLTVSLTAWEHYFPVPPSSIALWRIYMFWVFLHGWRPAVLYYKPATKSEKTAVFSSTGAPDWLAQTGPTSKG